MNYFCTTASATSSIDINRQMEKFPDEGTGHVNQGRYEKAAGDAKKKARAGVLRRGRIFIFARNLPEEQEKPTHTIRTKERGR